MTEGSLGLSSYASNGRDSLLATVLQSIIGVSQVWQELAVIYI
jgi:hypothetical protein